MTHATAPVHVLDVNFDPKDKRFVVSCGGVMKRLLLPILLGLVAIVLGLTACASSSSSGTSDTKHTSSPSLPRTAIVPLTEWTHGPGETSSQYNRFVKIGAACFLESLQNGGGTASTFVRVPCADTGRN